MSSYRSLRGGRAASSRRVAMPGMVVSGKTIWRVAAVGWVTAAALGVWAGARASAGAVVAADAGPPASLAPWIPEYPETRFYSLSAELRVDGIPRQLGYAVTADAPAKVAERYAGIWKSQGLRVWEQLEDESAYVAASEPTEPWLRTVMAVRGEVGTVILASLRSVWRGSEPSPVPLPDECRVVGQTDAVDHGVHTDVLFLTCQTAVAELLAFYDAKAPPPQNRRLVSVDGASDTAIASYADGHAQVSLVARQASLDPPRTAAVLTWQEDQ